MKHLLIAVLGFASIACALPPAVAPVPRDAAAAEPPSTGDAEATAPSTPPGTATSVPLPESKSLPNCPLATGKHQACTLGQVCTQDRNGCEQCRCREDVDPARARIESAEPWDTRQE
jgi:hypothetical protein